ncbi:hypothetical protein AYI68_g8380 [Smittium mucronatum]|uniref:Carbohydrate kinase PfkB domain-containing protein n=1 Tax=Smittium mucronatum TaxID=133383 RepID=A0A1R0GL29_9FUNG|nr:hypothetical protein AYI68_g8380 [Smittium mucronatum]
MNGHLLERVPDCQAFIEMENFEVPDINLTTRTVINQIKFISENSNISYIGVTDGPSKAIFYEKDNKTCSIITLPDLNTFSKSDLSDESTISSNSVSGESSSVNKFPIINPIGAGDVCSSIFLNLYLDNEIPPLEAFISGLAAASASCLVVAPNSVFNLKDMEEIRSLISFVSFNL